MGYSIEDLSIALSWFIMVWFVSATLSVLVAQLLLPQAWKALRANPPSGPGWARTLWYRRERVFGTLMALSLALGVLAAALFLFNSA